MHSLAGRSSSSGPPLVRRGASHCHQGRPGESRGPGPVVLAVGRVHTLYMRGQLSATALAAVVGCARQTASARPAPQAVTENPPLYPHTVSRSGYSCYPCIQIWIQLLLLYPDPGYRSLPSIRQVSKYPCVTRSSALMVYPSSVTHTTRARTARSEPPPQLSHEQGEPISLTSSCSQMLRSASKQHCASDVPCLVVQKPCQQFVNNSSELCQKFITFT